VGSRCTDGPILTEHGFDIPLDQSTRVDKLWPRLYDTEQLEKGVPVAATIYVNDMYVDRDFS
jgi:hypothetical protein